MFGIIFLSFLINISDIIRNIGFGQECRTYTNILLSIFLDMINFFTWLNLRNKRIFYTIILSYMSNILFSIYNRISVEEDGFYYVIYNILLLYMIVDTTYRIISYLKT